MRRGCGELRLVAHAAVQATPGVAAKLPETSRGFQNGSTLWSPPATAARRPRAGRPPTCCSFALGRQEMSGMALDWELREQGPSDAVHSALLLPGGMCSAGSFAEVMAEPALGGMRLVAATLPGQA